MSSCDNKYVQPVAVDGFTVVRMSGQFMMRMLHWFGWWKNLVGPQGCKKPSSTLLMYKDIILHSIQYSCTTNIISCLHLVHSWLSGLNCREWCRIMVASVIILKPLVTGFSWHLKGLQHCLCLFNSWSSADMVQVVFVLSSQWKWKSTAKWY